MMSLTKALLIALVGVAVVLMFLNLCSPFDIALETSARGGCW